MVSNECRLKDGCYPSFVPKKNATMPNLFLSFLEVSNRGDSTTFHSPPGSPLSTPQYVVQSPRVNIVYASRAPGALQSTVCYSVMATRLRSTLKSHPLSRLPIQGLYRAAVTPIRRPPVVKSAMKGSETLRPRVC